MIKTIQRLLYQFKEYVILVLLILISLTCISQSEKPQAKKLKAFAIGSFAFISDASTFVVSFFIPDESVRELQYENARLMLKLNKLQNKAKESEELGEMMALKDTSNFPLIPSKVVSKLVTKNSGELHY